MRISDWSSDVCSSDLVQSAPGQIKGKNTAINITAATDLRGIDDFRNMVVKSTSGGQVRLGDVATVELGGQNYDSDAMAEGHRAVFIGVAPTPDGQIGRAHVELQSLMRISYAGFC